MFFAEIKDEKQKPLLVLGLDGDPAFYLADTRNDCFKKCRCRLAAGQFDLSYLEPKESIRSYWVLCVKVADIALDVFDGLDHFGHYWLVSGARIELEGVLGAMDNSDSMWSFRIDDGKTG